MSTGTHLRHKIAQRSSDACAHALDFHLIDTEDGPHLLVVDGSQLFKIDDPQRSTRFDVGLAAGYDCVTTISPPSFVKVAAITFSRPVE